jgi:hypothetical protein
MREREGYEWKETNTGGYWAKKKGKQHKHKLAFFCPVPECRRITGTIDDECLLKYGFCKTCYVMYVEDRLVPAIDLTKYLPE